jgi:hypothetical protein
VTGKALFAKLLDERIRFGREVKRQKRGNACAGFFVEDSMDAIKRRQVCLRPKRKADVGDRSRVRGLNTGGYTLDVMTVIRFVA